MIAIIEKVYQFLWGDWIVLPLPGGMGISETLFLNIFSPVFGGLLLPGMVLSRGLGYYGELLISAAFTVVAQLTIGKKLFYSFIWRNILRYFFVFGATRFPNKRQKVFTAQTFFVIVVSIQRWKINRIFYLFYKGLLCGRRGCFFGTHYLNISLAHLGKIEYKLF